MFPRDVVLVDSCVWFSRTLRDWFGLFYLHSHGDAFGLRWTEEIYAEVMYRLPREKNIQGAELAVIGDRLRELMHRDNRLSEFDAKAYTCADPADAHLHAAALAGGCTAVVTLDVTGLVPVDTQPEELPYEIWTPDEFLCMLAESFPNVAESVLRHQARYWFKRNGHIDLGPKLRSANCPEFAACVAPKVAALDVSSLRYSS